MSEFCLTTTWSIPASIDIVWAYLVDTEAWPVWWKYVVAVEQTAEGDSSGINNAREYNWRTCLPYHLRLTLRVTEIQPLHWVAVEVTGDLQGSGRCQFIDQPEKNTTQVVFLWHVKTCRSWMNWFSALARPIFVWNHARVMKQGQHALIRYLSTLPK